ncbi:hypothetical protein [Pseudacidovorax sp. NFM-22]|uniref:hypothetical protein n=1 Tax=Pseudacidovorax sp. NFM-22 TaxID=2744469 RepID=UPI001F462E5D|nr:hypothetical protein [Pseudacidovorax sp. NFM-22]
MNTQKIETCMWMNFGLNSTECASWVQAWGSIAAILVAVAVFVAGHLIQRRSRIREEEATYTRQLEHAYQLIKGAARICRHVPEFIGPLGLRGADGQAMLAELHAYCDAFKKVDVSSMRTTNLFHAVLSGDALTRFITAQVEWFVKLDPTSLDDVVFGTYHVMAELLRQLESHAETVAIALRERCVEPESMQLIKKFVAATAAVGVLDHF